MNIDMSRFGILGFEIYIYLNPKIMNEEINVDGIDRKKLERYSTSIHILNEAFAKVKRYEEYFEHFYSSSDNIPDSEALHHHIHSYLEDIYLLSEAIKKLFGELKNDLQQVAPNKEKVCNSLDKCLSRILAMFDKARDHRRKHRHALSRFLDYDLVRSSSIQNMIKAGSPFLERFKAGAEEYLADEASRSFAESKEHWCNLSKQNNANISEQMERLFLSFEDLMYQFLGIEPILMSKLKDQLPCYKPVHAQ
ncbi:MAG: hypothetical protein PHH13_02255 [Candidatus Peribacteraceae bacterium]|nr:hypothetical protein [Candidatus Peribacteraceae bacterium]